jgi:hypothetical protein
LFRFACFHLGNGLGLSFNSGDENPSILWLSGAVYLTRRPDFKPTHCAALRPAASSSDASAAIAGKLTVVECFMFVVLFRSVDRCVILVFLEDLLVILLFKS